MQKIDMHIHTWASDGTWSPRVLLNKLNENKIKIFSVTDHDVIDSSEELKTLVLDTDLVFVPGVEVAVSYNNREYHLSVYNYKKNHEFLELINWNNLTRLEYNSKFLDLMSKNHMDINIDDYHNKYIEDRTKGGWKALNYLVDKGIYTSMFEFFDGIKNTDLVLEFKRPEEVIPLLKRTGALIFLSHPSYYYSNDVMPMKELIYWKTAGIDGIECYTPYAVENAQINYYKEFCVRNNLLVSGGSDCHGEFLPRKIGCPNIDISDLMLDGLFENHGIKGKYSNIYI